MDFGVKHPVYGLPRVVSLTYNRTWRDDLENVERRLLNVRRRETHIQRIQREVSPVNKKFISGGMIRKTYHKFVLPYHLYHRRVCR